MNKWVIGARLRTMPAAIAPVLSATTLAYNKNNSINLVNGVLALFVGICLQVGVNYSNDYSDGIKGTDEERVIENKYPILREIKTADVINYIRDKNFPNLIINKKKMNKQYKIFHNTKFFPKKTPKIILSKHKLYTFIQYYPRK